MFQGTRNFSYEQFDFLEELGRGAFGVVYKAFDRIARLDVAIKQIDLESTDEINEIQQEINILAACNNSNVTKYFGSFLRGTKLLIVMEYLGGGSCSDLLAAGPFGEDVIALICHELLQALVYLHDTGKIHRDIKAANVLIGSDGSVKIADFGVATQLSNNLSKRNTFVGTPYWMPPEIILHEEYSTSADIWSLGITAMELAYGKPPLSNFHPFDVLFKIADDPPPSPGANFSQEFNSFVEYCLQKDPRQRPKAKSLLGHKFIKRVSSSNNKNSIVKLIHKKKQWDIEIGNETKTPYISAGIRSSAPVQFDLDTVNGEDISQQTATIQAFPKQDQSPSYGKLYQAQYQYSDNSADDQVKGMKRDLNRVLNQAFSKISAQNNLTTQQYDSLVNYQTLLFSSLFQGSDPQFNAYFAQLLKYTNQGVLKSGNKALKEKFFPRSLIEMDIKTKKDKEKEKDRDSNVKDEVSRSRDDIEELLLTRWAEGVINRYK